MPSPATELLLFERLNTMFEPSELRRLAVEFSDSTGSLADWLPGDTISRRELFDAFVAWLARRDLLITGLVPALRRVRPQRERDISEIENQVRGDDQLTWGKGVRWSLREGLRLRDGRYQLLQAVGGGSYGDVWAATRIEDGTRVAIKFLRWTGERLNEDLRRQFFRGANLIARVHHPNVVRVVEARCEEGGLDYYVMEHVDGELFERAASWMSDDDCLRVLQELSSALLSIHAHGIVYRDVNPRNIMITSAGAAKLIDCDLACPQRSDGFTRHGESIFLAPEVRRDGAETAASDVFSLAVTGVFAFHRARLPLECAHSEFMQSFIQNKLSCGKPVRQVLEAACDRNPARRPSIPQFSTALQRAHLRAGAIAELRELTKEALGCRGKAEMPRDFVPRGGRTDPDATVREATTRMRHQAWCWLRVARDPDRAEGHEDGWSMIRYLLSGAADPWNRRFHIVIESVRASGGTAEEILEAFVETPPAYEP